MNAYTCGACQPSRLPVHARNAWIPDTTIFRLKILFSTALHQTLVSLLAYAKVCYRFVGQCPTSTADVIKKPCVFTCLAVDHMKSLTFSLVGRPRGKWRWAEGTQILPASLASSVTSLWISEAPWRLSVYYYSSVFGGGGAIKYTVHCAGLRYIFKAPPLPSHWQWRIIYGAVDLGSGKYDILVCVIRFCCSLEWCWSYSSLHWKRGSYVRSPSLCHFPFWLHILDLLSIRLGAQIQWKEHMKL